MHSTVSFRWFQSQHNYGNIYKPNILLLDAKPNKIQLLYKYANIELMKNLVPTLQQIRNRSTALKAKRAETFKIKQIKDNNSIKAYVNSKIITSSEAYNSLNSDIECFLLHSFYYNTKCQKVPSYVRRNPAGCAVIHL